MDKVNSLHGVNLDLESCYTYSEFRCFFPPSSLQTWLEEIIELPTTDFAQLHDAK